MRIGSEDLNFFKKENEGNSVFFLDIWNLWASVNVSLRSQF